MMALISATSGDSLGGPLFEQVDDRGAAVANGRQQQLLLGRHVPEEGARRNACGSGDFLRRHGVVSAFDEQPERRPPDVGPDLRALPSRSDPSPAVTGSSRFHRRREWSAR